MFLASQYWCLARKLPLLIGDRIPEDNEYWTILLLLLEVVDIIMAPRIRRDTLPYLQWMTSILFSEFKRLFPEERMTPKYHFIMFYSDFIAQVGPLINFWVMRFEGKHKYFKKIINTTGNFKNVPHTLANQHQLYLASLVNSKKLFHHDTDMTGQHQIPKADIENECRVVQFELAEICFSVKTIDVDGIAYRNGQVLTASVSEDDIPTFAVINRIITSNGEIFFMVYDLLVGNLVKHFNAWDVEYPVVKRLYLLPLRTLVYEHPLSIHRSAESLTQKYVNPKFILQAT